MVLLIFGLFKGENNTLKTKLMIYFVLSKIVERGHVCREQDEDSQFFSHFF